MQYRCSLCNRVFESDEDAFDEKFGYAICSDCLSASDVELLYDIAEDEDTVMAIEILGVCMKSNKKS